MGVDILLMGVIVDENGLKLEFNAIAFANCWRFEVELDLDNVGPFIELDLDKLGVVYAGDGGGVSLTSGEMLNWYLWNKSL